MSFWEKVKSKLSNTEEVYDNSEEYDEYVELNGGSSGGDSEKSKVMVRTFELEDFEDIKGILDSLRQGYTIALVNIKTLKERDITELRRAINKLKKTCDAISGDIAGFGGDYIVAVPSFAEIFRDRTTEIE